MLINVMSVTHTSYSLTKLIAMDNVTLLSNTLMLTTFAKIVQLIVLLANTLPTHAQHVPQDSN